MQRLYMTLLSIIGPLAPISLASAADQPELAKIIAIQQADINRLKQQQQALLKKLQEAPRFLRGNFAEEMANGANYRPDYDSWRIIARVTLPKGTWDVSGQTSFNAACDVPDPVKTWQVRNLGSAVTLDPQQPDGPRNVDRHSGPETLCSNSLTYWVVEAPIRRIVVTEPTEVYMVGYFSGSDGWGGSDGYIEAREIK